MIKSILVVYTVPRNKEQRLSLNYVKKILKKLNAKFETANRDKLKKSQFGSKELVIAVGGDGTFLRAAHFIERQLILGVNSDVKDKEGFFMKSHRKNFEEKFSKILKGNFKVRKLPRLQAQINGKKTDALAVNEFFIGPRKSYHAAKYAIMAKGRREKQKSSGILITTAFGSHAWARSCIAKTMPLDSKNFQFVVREPYQGKVFKNYRLKHGMLKSGKKISIISEMLDGVAVADSVGKEHRFNNRSKATISMSKRPLSAIWL